MQIVILLFFGVVLSSFILRVIGFGFGISIMAILLHIMPTGGEATTLSGILAFVCGIGTAIKYRHHLHLSRLLALLLSFSLFAAVSVWSISVIDARMLKKMVGAVLILLSLYFFFTDGGFHIRPSRLTNFVVGMLSGLMGGLFAMQGPPAVVYVLSITKSKEEYTSNIQWYLIFTNIILTSLRAGNGYLTEFVGECILYSLPAIFVGVYIGSKVYFRINIRILKRAVYFFLAISGLAAMF